MAVGQGLGLLGQSSYLVQRRNCLERLDPRSPCGPFNYQALKATRAEDTWCLLPTLEKAGARGSGLGEWGV